MGFRYKNQDVHFKGEREKKYRSEYTYTKYSMSTDNKKAPLWRTILDYIIILGIAFLLGQVINQLLITNAYVPTSSMESTIPAKSRVIGNRLAYINHMPERGDIIIFPYPDNEEDIFIKRIIGLPGETVEVIDGTVFINDVALEETYLKEDMIGNFGPFTVPENSYFVMGDNRNDSLDSRYWTNKFVTKDKIQSKAICVLFPEFKIFK